MTYEQLVSEYISEKYSLSQEIAIQRQRDTKPKEFAEYNSYCEECKVRAKANLKAYNAEQEKIAAQREKADKEEAELRKLKEIKKAETEAARKAERKAKEAERQAKEEQRAKEKAELENNRKIKEEPRKVKKEQK